MIIARRIGAAIAVLWAVYHLSRLSGVGILDASGAKQLADVFVELNERGITTMIKGLRPEHLKAAQSVGIIDALTSPTYLFDSIEEAAASARKLVAEGL